MCGVPFDMINDEIAYDERQNASEDIQYGSDDPQFQVLRVDPIGTKNTLWAEESYQADLEVVQTTAQGLFPLFLKHKAFLVATSLQIFQQKQALTNPAIFKYPG